MTNTFAVNASTGYVEGEAQHIAVTVTNGHVTLTPSVAPNTWTEADYAAYLEAQQKKENK